MIFKLLFGIIKLILGAFFGLLNLLPSMPDGIISVVDSYITLICDNAFVVDVFFPVSFAFSCAAIAISVNFILDHFDSILWVLRKIPFLNIN